MADDPTNPFTEDDLAIINDGLERSMQNEKMLQRAQRAGIPVNITDTQIREGREALLKIKREFFPDAR